MSTNENTIINNTVNGAKNIWQKYPAASRVSIGIILLLMVDVSPKTLIAALGGYCVIRGVKMAIAKAKTK